MLGAQQQPGDITITQPDGAGIGAARRVPRRALLR
jgi:hypothetical protein